MLQNITASGVTQDTIMYLKDCFVKKREVSDVIHQKMLTHLNRYLVIGGMPAAVNAYIETSFKRTLFANTNYILQNMKRKTRNHRIFTIIIV